MACPRCGDHMLTPVGRQLVCCGCGRPRPQQTARPVLAWLRAHGPILLGVVLLVPLAIGMGSLDALQMAARTSGAAPATPEGPLERQP